MQRKQNIRLFIILLILIGGSAAIQLVDFSKDNLSYDKKLFQLDPEKEINEVVLENAKGTNHFQYANGRWHLNDSLLLDQSMRDVFFSVVSQVEIRRPVLTAKADSIAEIIKSTGVYTRISFGTELIQQYWVGGNQQQQISWIMGEDGIPYQVHIPGYQSFVAGIFNVPTTDWRSRFLLDVNFALIRSIEMDYADAEDDLVLDFKNNFFAVRNTNADSAKITEFLDELAYLQADQFLNTEEGSSIELDDAVFATLKLQMVSGSSSSISFFSEPNNGQNIIAKLTDGSLARVNRKRLTGLFKKPGDFE